MCGQYVRNKYGTIRTQDLIDPNASNTVLISSAVRSQCMDPTYIRLDTSGACACAVGYINEVIERTQATYMLGVIETKGEIAGIAGVPSVGGTIGLTGVAAEAGGVNGAMGGDIEGIVMFTPGRMAPEWCGRPTFTTLETAGFNLLRDESQIPTEAHEGPHTVI